MRHIRDQSEKAIQTVSTIRDTTKSSGLRAWGRHTLSWRSLLTLLRPANALRNRANKADAMQNELSLMQTVQTGDGRLGADVTAHLSWPDRAYCSCLFPVCSTISVNNKNAVFSRLLYKNRLAGRKTLPAWNSKWMARDLRIWFSMINGALFWIQI